MEDGTTIMLRVGLLFFSVSVRSDIRDLFDCSNITRFFYRARAFYWTWFISELRYLWYMRVLGHQKPRLVKRIGKTRDYILTPVSQRTWEFRHLEKRESCIELRTL